MTIAEQSGMEPELESPPPRRIRPRLRGRLVRGLFILLGVIVPVMLAWLGQTFQRDLAALRAHGVETIGRVTQKSPSMKANRLPRVCYEYVAGGDTYAFWDSVLQENFDTLQLGQEAAVVYLPERPSVGVLADDVRREDGTSAEAVALWFVAAILAIVMVPCWMYLEWIQRRIRSLARDGVPVRAKILSAEPYKPNVKGSNSWRVTYEFQVDGRPYTSSVTVLRQVGEALGGPGAQVTVLYDPDDAARNQLYSAVDTLYRVAPA